MKLYTFVTGLDVNGKPILLHSPVNFCATGWALIDTREIHFNVSQDEILKLAKVAQAELDKVVDNE
jgi:hypothetical protein